MELTFCSNILKLKHQKEIRNMSDKMEDAIMELKDQIKDIECKALDTENHLKQQVK